MRLIVQRSKESSVSINSKVVGKISSGLVVLVGFTHTDTIKDIEYCVRKLVNLRIFDDEKGVMNKSILDVGGSILSISQFTLYADTKKGNRPSYIKAMNGSVATKLYDIFNEKLREYVNVETGVFGADMMVSINNDGPITIIIESGDLMEKKINYKLVNLTLIILAIFFLYKTGNLWMGMINKIVDIILPFLFAFALAYALHPILKYMQKKKIPKGLGVTIIVLILALIVAALIYVVSTVLVGQLSNLFNSILAFINKLSNYDFGSDVNLSGLESSLNDIFKNIMASVGQYVSNGTIHLVNSSLGILSKVCIAAAAFVYLLIDMDKIRDGVRKFFKKRTKKTYEFVSSLDHQMKKYLSGLVIVMIISVFEYSIVYSLIGHPDALLLGLLAGFANLIPYFGGIMNNCVAAVTAFVISPSLFIKTLIVFTVLSMVDSYIINANVYGKTNSIHPLIVIFSVFAGSAIFGIMGIVISFPMAILGVTAFKFYKDDIFDSIKSSRKNKELS